MNSGEYRDEGHGYYPFPVLGHDPGRRLWQVGPGARRLGANGKRAAERVRTIGFQGSQVATWFWWHDLDEAGTSWSQAATPILGRDQGRF